MSERNRSLGDVAVVIKALLPYKRRYWRVYVGQLAALVVGVLASGVFTPILFRSFVDTLSAAGGSPDVVLPALWTLLAGIGGLMLLNVAAATTADLLVTFNVAYVQRDMDEDAFGVVHRLSYAFFSRSFLGAIVAKARRFSEAADAFDYHLTRGLFITMVQFVASMVVLWVLLPVLSILFVAWAIVFVGLTIPLVRWKMVYDVHKAKKDSLVTARLADSIGNFLAIKMFARFGKERDEFHAVTTERAEAQRRSWLISSTINCVHGLFIVVMEVAMLVLVLWLWQRGAISVGTVVLVQTYLLILGSQLTDVGNRLKNIQRAAAECVEMIEIFQEKPEVEDPANPEPVRISAGAIEIDRVGFRYQNGRKVFEDFSLSIPAGEKVGLVGYSGSGKTTLTRLILRFADVTSGAIRIDGQDIRRVAQDDLRRSVSYVPQDTILFHRSVRDNIAYAKPDASEEELREAARRAYAEEFIERLPDGYDTLVGERGIQLSGGERQRIALARALLRDTPILILDEATSSLDSVSEHYIQEALRDIMRNRTTIVVAHRLSTMRLMDRIVVLDEGRFVEEGTHETLLAKKGLYAELHAHQVDGMIAAGRKDAEV